MVFFFVRIVKTVVATGCKPLKTAYSGSVFCGSVQLSSGFFSVAWAGPSNTIRTQRNYWRLLNLKTIMNTIRNVNTQLLGTPPGLGLLSEPAQSLNSLRSLLMQLWIRGKSMHFSSSSVVVLWVKICWVWRTMPSLQKCGNSHLCFIHGYVHPCAPIVSPAWILG